MPSATTWIAIVMILGLIGLGVAQNLHLPHSSLAGAVSDAPKTQAEINGCMQKCMETCVTAPGTENTCLQSCNKHCGV